ncbi:hypothetical protein APUTEX25_001897 [Auxenochlorella protothecoides]|uniref:Protein kinase and PP2C-like domain-containing protein n=1 Tax=Auxenochlorella protothecoides TaxID=3075 RepID=A0A3M7L548_AUXPR|nr:hypothetical protein APUTEX25_001897 [Auxenochlorella protothecoides]|eukprot:RMZ57697.1 hypothetical protein APUTEX25_001897 [Auxenochlorella protothecoides]
MESVVAAMAIAVRAGDIAGAAQLASQASFPLAISPSDISIVSALTHGGQATVWSAVFRDPSASQDQPPSLVALKRPSLRTTTDLDAFRREVQLLGSLPHPNLVTLVGARLLPPGYFMLTALEAGGDAARLLHREGWRPSLALLCHLGSQAASALSHLHAHGIVHRDVKPANMLLDAGRAFLKLADLGIALCSGSRHHEEAPRAPGTGQPSGGFHKLHMVGTLEYLAPEVLLGARHTPASDIYSLGICLNELATAQLPYSDAERDDPLMQTCLEMGYSRQDLRVAIASGGLRPSVAPDAPPELTRLISQCWVAGAGERPGAAQVAQDLARLAIELAGKEEEAGAPRGGSPGPPVLVAGEKAESFRHTPSPLERGTDEIATPENGGLGLVPPWVQAYDRDGPGHAQPGAPLGLGAKAVAGRRGEDRMEDRHFILPDILPRGAPGPPQRSRHALLGVFDGHRGPQAAQYLAERLPGLLEGALPGSSGAAAWLAAGLAAADAGFCSEWGAGRERSARGGGPCPGSTALLVLLSCRRAALAWVGDGRAVLCRGGRALALTAEHTPGLEGERARIARAGGRLTGREGGLRLGAAGLSVSRAIGDLDLRQDGLIPDADKLEVDLRPLDDFVILASDGLWDVMTNQEAVCLVQDTVKHPTMCAQRLVEAALARGSGDNITCIVAMLGLGEESMHEVAYSRGAHKYAGGGLGAPAP